jgi:hypothetical protein
LNFKICSDALNNNFKDNQPFLGITTLPDISPHLKSVFSPNFLKHVILLASYLSKFLELREAYVRIVLTSHLIQIFDELTDADHPIDNKIKYSNLPDVIST